MKKKSPLQQVYDKLQAAFSARKDLTAYECDPVHGDRAFAVNVPVEEHDEGVNIFVELTQVDL